MNAKDLLSLRFEVIAEYPKCKYERGEILVRIKKATEDLYDGDENAYVGGIFLYELEKYPHLFRKMNWWEKRNKEDMPKRVMSLADNKKSTYDIEEWDMDILVGWIDKGVRSCCSLTMFKPEFGYIPVD